MDINPTAWTEEEKKTATEKAEQELKEAQARKTELEAELAALGEIESVQIKNQIKECEAIISEHQNYDVEKLKEYTLRTDYVMSGLSIANKYCDQQIKQILIDNEFWEVEEELSFRTECCS